MATSKISFVCKSCTAQNGPFTLDSDYRYLQYDLFDIIKRQMYPRYSVDCGSCGATSLFVVALKGDDVITDVSYLGLQRDHKNIIFDNIGLCVQTVTEQEQLLTELRCAITGALFVRLPSRIGERRSDGVGVVYRNSRTSMYDYSNCMFITLKAYRGLKKCQGCGFSELDTVTDTTTTLQTFYNTDDTTCYLCNKCIGRYEPKFFGYRFHTEKGHTKKLNPFDRYVGMEIETFGGDKVTPFSMPKSLVNRVKCVHDGSIRSSNRNVEEDDTPTTNDSGYEEDDDDEGREFVTVPMANDKLFTLIDDVTFFLKKQGCMVNKSCGYHIHFDMRKENYHTVRKTFIAFSIFENVLFDMLPQSRRVSRYCLPLTKNYKQFFGRGEQDAQQSFTRYWYGSSNESQLSRYKKEKYHPSRYVSINYHALFFHGTLENRMHSGTINPLKMKNWILLNHIIIDFAKHTTMERLLKMNGDMKTLVNIIRSYERRYPVLCQYDLVSYVSSRVAVFSNKDVTPMRVIDELQPNNVENSFITHQLRNLPK